MWAPFPPPDRSSAKASEKAANQSPAASARGSGSQRTQGDPYIKGCLKGSFKGSFKGIL